MTKLAKRKQDFPDLWPLDRRTDIPVPIPATPQTQRSLVKRMDELNAFAHHQVQWKSISETYQTATEAMMRLTLGHMGVDPETIPPTLPAFPPPFHFHDDVGPQEHEEGVVQPEFAEEDE